MNIEGRNAVSEALKADTTFESLLVEKGMQHSIVAMARSKGVKIQFVDKAVLDKISVTKKHQGFIGKITDFEYCEVEDILNLA